MKLIKKGQGQPFDAKGHSNQWTMTILEAGKDTERLSVRLSHYLPEGSVEMSASPREIAYFCLAGKLLVTGKKGEEYTLEPGDVFYIPAGEERAVTNPGTEVSTIVVFAINLD